MSKNEPAISHYLVSLFTHHQYDEIITTFLDKLLPGSYASQFPIKTDKGFDICYELYCDSIEAQASTHESIEGFCKNSFETNAYTIEKSTILASDWQNEWKRFFKPIHIGDRLVIAPSWEKYDVPENAAIVRLDPGMAFGTGSHGTTKGCLHFLEKYVTPGMKVLDFGAGSGVLAIAAHKLGAGIIHAVDNDPLAISVSIENSKVNNCSDKIQFNVGSLDAIPDRDYHLVVANLTVAIHIELLDGLLAYCKNASYLILSGISAFSRPELDKFLKERNLKPTEVYEEDDWFTYLKKHSTLR